MKQSAAKTLGVAALGAAFAAAAAGSASAVPALPDAGAALDAVTSTVPAEVTSQLPAGASEGLTAGRAAVGVVQQTAPTALGAAPTANPLTGLLGGLPVNGLVKGLPLGGLPLGG
jgi:hypothetical protein